MSNEYTPAPWSILEVENDAPRIANTEIEQGVGVIFAMGNASRIIDCVNACADMDCPQHEIADLRHADDILKVISGLIDGVKYSGTYDNGVMVLKQQHAELLSALERIVAAVNAELPSKLDELNNGTKLITRIYGTKSSVRAVDKRGA